MHHKTNGKDRLTGPRDTYVGLGIEVESPDKAKALAEGKR